MFNHTEINVGAYWFAVITIAYILISAFVNPRDEMYASIIGMPLGILWAMYERKIDSYFMLFETENSVSINNVFSNKLKLGNTEKQSIEYMEEHAPEFSNYEEFMRYCFDDEEEK